MQFSFTYGGTITAGATGGGSGKPPVFSVDPKSVAICTSGGTNGSQITAISVGTCTVDADQADGNGYSAAPQVTRSFTVDPAPLTITASSASIVFGDAIPAITPRYAGLENGNAAPASPPKCSTAAASGSRPVVPKQLLRRIGFELHPFL